MDLRGYFDSLDDGRWGPSKVERPATNGNQAPPRPRAASGVSFSHDLSHVQPIERRTPGEQARIDQAVSYIHDLARKLGGGGGWETR